jgi:hypothetical protein
MRRGRQMPELTLTVEEHNRLTEWTRRRKSVQALGSTVEFERLIRDYLAAYNQNPTPFVWHKTADQIIESVGRFCKRINDSVH